MEKVRKLAQGRKLETSYLTNSVGIVASQMPSEPPHYTSELHSGEVGTVVRSCSACSTPECQGVEMPSRKFQTKGDNAELGVFGDRFVYVFLAILDYTL